MKSLIFTLSLCLFAGWSMAQNYYVAVVKGEVYYQDKLLKKKDKVAPNGDIRFKNGDSYVKLSGPGGLYTLTPDMGVASGSEFLLALRNELFPSVRPRSTARMSRPASTRGLWRLEGKYYSFIENTVLIIDPLLTSKGQTIAYVHETEKGLIHRKVKIDRGSQLVILRRDFEPGKGKNAPQKILKTAILQARDPAILDSLLGVFSTIEALMEAMPFYDTLQQIPADFIVPDYQILDLMEKPRVIKKQEFVKDMRFHIKQCKATTQSGFLESSYDEYIRETYGNIYQLPKVLEDLVGLPQ